MTLSRGRAGSPIYGGNSIGFSRISGASIVATVAQLGLFDAF